MCDVTDMTSVSDVTGVTGITGVSDRHSQYVTNTKRKWAEHIARMKDNRWTVRSTE